jgi:hypothetical protein
VALMIAVMVASAVFVWEPWPFTSFRLFSHVRHDEQTGWEATAVGPGGGETAYPVAAEDRGLRGFGFAMVEFQAASPARRDELCRAWLALAPQAVGSEVSEVRLYQRTWKLSEREGGRALPGTRRHVYSCTRAGAVASGGASA